MNKKENCVEYKTLPKRQEIRHKKRNIAVKECKRERQKLLLLTGPAFRGIQSPLSLEIGRKDTRLLKNRFRKGRNGVTC